MYFFENEESRRRFGTAPADFAKDAEGAISRNAYFFNSHRMMRRYSVETYLH